MGFYQTQSSNEFATSHEALIRNSISQEDDITLRPTLASSGRIVVYGDSNCADNSHMQKGTFFRITLLGFVNNIPFKMRNRLLLDVGCGFGLCSYWR